jgi:hypothetical protein
MQKVQLGDCPPQFLFTSQSIYASRTQPNLSKSKDDIYNLLLTKKALNSFYAAKTPPFLIIKSNL